MAEGMFSINHQPINYFIQCIHCPVFFELDPDDYRAKLHAEDYLHSISHTLAGCEYLDEYYFDTANVPCRISCPHCDEDFETVAQVSACPIWNYDDMLEGRVSDICRFEDVKILKVSMSLEITMSIQECFKCDIDLENPEGVELNAQNGIGSIVVPCLNLSCILKIIAKTNMNKGICYLGLEESTNCIYRPIFNIFNQQCCWPINKQLILGKLYKFDVIAYPNPTTYFTPFPHRKEDMIVSGFVCCGLPIPTPVYPSLSHLAKKDIKDIFKDIKKKRYVYENTKCSSVGILRSCAFIQFNEFKKKNYCKILCKSGVYFLPITAMTYDNIGISYTDALIVLGLGRPYRGKTDEYDPARCYLIVVGIYSPNVQYFLPF
ncbi:Hypothetical predicted protein [Mytilus galloprovincialis]|uniref:Uncharacterized protein n=1 Tax=Mytilus galloprovincialis TaxID=29158 RepID=A0A8B6BZC4_MYTGA|nr:Hypothetical predicted protein [Mytilus galloprovincialis]